MTRPRSARTPSRSASAGRSASSCCGRPMRAASSAAALRGAVPPRALPVLQRLADVVGHEAGGELAVAGADGGHDRHVLGDVGTAPLGARRPRGEQPAADLDDPERAEHGHELGVAGRAREHEVEVAAGVMRIDPRLGRLLAPDRLLQADQVTVRAARGGEPRDPRLEQRADLEPAQDVVDARAGGAEAAVGHELGQALARQPAQRLAHRRARDAELLGQLDLPEPRAGRDLARHDHAPDALVGEVDDRVRADVTG